MQIPVALVKLLSDDVLPITTPVDPMLKEIIVRCVEEGGEWGDISMRISAEFGALSERIDVVLGIVLGVVNQLRR